MAFSSLELLFGKQSCSIVTPNLVTASQLNDLSLIAVWEVPDFNNNAILPAKKTAALTKALDADFLTNMVLTFHLVFSYAVSFHLREDCKPSRRKSQELFYTILIDESKDFRDS